LTEHHPTRIQLILFRPRSTLAIFLLIRYVQAPRHRQSPQQDQRQGKLMARPLWETQVIEMALEHYRRGILLMLKTALGLEAWREV
jgi:hypothetical protein